MGKFYVLNAPYGFSTVFSMIKPFLDPVTVEKIHILGRNYQEELLQQIPAENLPVSLGGKSDAPGGVELADEGPWREDEFLGPEGVAPISSVPPSYSVSTSTLASETPSRTMSMTSSKAPSRTPSIRSGTPLNQ
jgi:hypothetical protein